MWLSKLNLKNISPTNVVVPNAEIFDLPEKVLQFGTGVLLRGLPDYFIDKANRQGIFNGRIVVVKSTDGGDSTAFDKQDGLYTICVRGIEDGNKVEQNIVSSSVSRVLSAKSEWNKILECAHNPEMDIIISNTTEVGIQLVKDDISSYPPVSYPGKLLAFLYERYKAFEGSPSSGMVIVPTELIVDNGKKLEAIVSELAHLNSLEENFIDWLESSNTFCSSLVDRIVPGKPETTLKKQIEQQLGYNDDLMLMTEVYRLWAIEGDSKVQDVLSFSKVDKGVVVTGKINQFRELKLRLLNGTHTLSCGVAVLSGVATVKEAMDNEQVRQYINAIQKEISKAIPYSITEEERSAFSKNCLERFSNPFIEHQWISITVQYSSKLKLRVVPVLMQHYANSNTVPQNMAIGFAAFIRFMKVVEQDSGKYFGSIHGNVYPVNDDRAAYFYEKLQKVKPTAIATAVLKDIALWDNDLSALPGFATEVQDILNEIDESGMMSVLNRAQAKISIV